jgi:hypothetical protein
VWSVKKDYRVSIPLVFGRATGVGAYLTPVRSLDLGPLGEVVGEKVEKRVSIRCDVVELRLAMTGPAAVEDVDERCRRV